GDASTLRKNDALKFAYYTQNLSSSRIAFNEDASFLIFSNCLASETATMPCTDGLFFAFESVSSSSLYLSLCGQVHPGAYF
ncbi:MAG: hypothetical protein ACI363_05315, partial [Phocaeicola plebeius]